MDDLLFCLKISTIILTVRQVVTLGSKVANPGAWCFQPKTNLLKVGNLATILENMLYSGTDKLSASNIQTLAVRASYCKKEASLNEQGLLPDEQEPLFDEQEPLFDEQEPLFDEQEALFDEQEPLFDEQEALFDEQEALFDEQEPLLDEQEPSLCKQEGIFSTNTPLP